MSNVKHGDGTPTVLVVDDDVETAGIYTESLADEYTVLTAHSGEEALRLVNPDVDVVLLDRRMPGISGDDVLRTIRERNLDCRVVMVTGIPPDMEILDLPFDDYLVKPISTGAIHDAVARMLVRRECDDTMQEAVALVTKMATLEAKMTIQELEASTEYSALREELAELREETDITGPEGDIYSELATEKMRALFA